MKEMVNVDLLLVDILVIYWVLGGGRGVFRLVIVKFCDIDIKIWIIKNCLVEKVKKYFIMYDYLILLNVKLICDFKDDFRIYLIWYYNGKVFVLDNEGNRYKFDILDDIIEKLK